MQTLKITWDLVEKITKAICNDKIPIGDGQKKKIAKVVHNDQGPISKT